MVCKIGGSVMWEMLFLHFCTVDFETGWGFLDYLQGVLGRPINRLLFLVWGHFSN